MIALTFGLAALALALAWPVPVVLSQAAWPRRAPARALLLWQVIALAGGFSIIGALVAAGFAFSFVFFAAGAVLAAHLLLTLLATVVSTERERRRHRELVTLLSNPSPDLAATRVIDYDAPAAWCLPVGIHSVTVLSAGLIRMLEPAQLQAVIAHERAHLQQRHWVVLTAFTAWHRALPWFPIATRARRAVNELVEMLADDRAAAAVGATTVADAIAIVAASSEQSAADALATRRRIDRLGAR